jgi:hypothetical protein
MLLCWLMYKEMVGANTGYGRKEIEAERFR